MQVLSLYDAIARWGFHEYFSERPLLCGWFNLDPATCLPGLITLHIAHFILALVAIKFSPILLNKVSNWHVTTLDTIVSWLQTD